MLSCHKGQADFTTQYCIRYSLVQSESRIPKPVFVLVFSYALNKRFNYISDFEIYCQL